ncbi:GNAT family N-acetyltransferase [Thalassobacillus hwangdonensis]|uniref:GNAT family N-acetyltransferase n=1 Tax=Thalassobacillus hwangdonensis TaxID=546108 RepID=A0ABW3KVY3_9BACI
MDLETPRLQIKAIDLETAQVLMKNALAFYYKYQLPWSEDWPHDGLRALLPLYAEQVEADETSVGFGPWFIIDKHHQRIIGDIGFKGRPDQEGAVEIGYCIVPEERGAGYASEAVEYIVQWAFQNGAKSVQAQCDRENIPSQKVLINNRFVNTDKQDKILLFKREKKVHDHYKERSKRGL